MLSDVPECVALRRSIATATELSARATALAAYGKRGGCDATFSYGFSDWGDRLGSVESFGWIPGRGRCARKLSRVNQESGITRADFGGLGER